MISSASFLSRNSGILLFLGVVSLWGTLSVSSGGPFDKEIPNLKKNNSKPNTKEKPKAINEASPFNITPDFLEKNRFDTKEMDSVNVVDPKKLPVYKSRKVIEADLPAVSGPLPRTEIIVDSSGSMGQLLNSDKTKMFHLKKMLSRFYSEQWKELESNSLRVYGARRKNDCDDTRQVIKPGTKSLYEIEDHVKKLLPIGRTPIYKTIKESIDSIKDYKGPKRVVIFTDGEETCGGDPCKLTKETSIAKTMDIKFFVVAIGFPPGKDSLKKVTCLGDTSTANSESELFKAFGDIQSQINTRINLQVISPEPAARTQLFKVLPNGELKLEKVFTSSLGVTVPPGDYEAVVMLDPPFRFPKFTIPPKKKVTLQVVGLGQSLVKFHDGLLNVELLDKNGKAVSSFTSDQISEVPTGRFKLRAFRDPFFSKLIEPIVITPDGVVEKEIVDAGSVVFEHEGVAGFYIYDSSEKLLGNFVTNFPLVLPRGSYRFHLNDQCSFDNVRIDFTGKIETVSCSSMKNDRITRVLTERKLSFEDYIDVLEKRIEDRNELIENPAKKPLEPDILLEGTKEEEMIDFLKKTIEYRKGKNK